MRSIDSKILVAVLSLIGWAAVVPASKAQVESQLVILTNVWRYNAGKSNPPAAWTNNTFVDSAWPQGMASIGHEETALPVPIPFGSDTEAPNNNGPLTIYCRTHFNYNLAAIGTNGVSLVFSNLIDDGAIYYLNGREIQRIGMPAGTPTYNTFANRTVGDATSFEVFTIQASGSSIRNGDNVLAVETHNVNGTSSDTVFCTSLTAVQPTRIVITDQPDNALTSVGTPVSLSVAVTGSNPYYRWFKVPSPVPVATGPTYTLNSPQLSSSGDYYAIITNVLGAVTSTVARVTVIPDTFAPAVLSAAGQTVGASNTIFITFSENVLSRTATNPASYRLEVVGSTNRVTVSNAVASQNTATITVGGPNWRWGSNYILTVTGVSDTRGNYMNGLSNRVAVSFLRNVFRLGWDSKHFDWVIALGQIPGVPATNLADNWMMQAYNDSDPTYWPIVQGVAFHDNNLGSTGWYACGPRGTDTGDLGEGSGWPRAYYFRTRFVVPPNTGHGSLLLTASIDDGAVSYLNGVEIWRYNVPAGKLDMYTSAINDIDPNSCVTDLVDVTNLVSGTNLLATEVHNTSDANTLDYYFGVAIDALIAPPVLPALTIRRTNTVPPAVVVSWIPTNFPGWALVGRTNGTTTNWTQLTTNSPFQLNVTNNTMREFKLVPGP